MPTVNDNVAELTPLPAGTRPKGHRLFVCFIYKLSGTHAQEACRPGDGAHVNCGWGHWKPER